MKLKVFYFLFLLLPVVSPPAQAEKCLEQWACWDVRKVDGRFEFWVTNLKPYVFTASLKVSARNLRDRSGERRRFEVSETMAGNSTRLVLTLYPAKPNRSVDYRDIFYWTPGDQDAVHDDHIEYVAPFTPGESYPLVQGFGGGWSHSGASKYAVDFAMPIGTAVHAARSGDVVQVVSHNNRSGSSRRYAKYANYIVVLHSDGTTGEYYHLMEDGAVVKIGDTVVAGQRIGFSGNTGFSSLPHLHFAVYRPKPMGDFESLPFTFEAGLATRRSWWW